MDYSKYKQSRDLSWQVLIDNNIVELPVKVSDICKRLDIPIISYQKGYQIIEKAGLVKQCAESDGITFNRTIFYNQECNIGRQRFTVAHELAHILLHTESTYNREPSPKDNPIEQEANVFASRILAPACVLWGLGVTSAEEIARLCDISITSAQFRMERLNSLYEREEAFKKKYGKSCFLMSPLEQRVYNQFSSYIYNNKL